MASTNEDLNKEAKKARTFLYLLFLIFYLWHILVGIVVSYPGCRQPSNVESLGTIQLRDCQQITFVILKAAIYQMFGSRHFQALKNNRSVSRQNSFWYFLFIDCKLQTDMPKKGRPKFPSVKFLSLLENFVT